MKFSDISTENHSFRKPSNARVESWCLAAGEILIDRLNDPSFKTTKVVSRFNDSVTHLNVNQYSRRDLLSKL